jgi:Mrp family chromosome partitioning ATPase
LSSIAEPDLDERPVPDLLRSIWRYRLTVLILAAVAALAGAAIRMVFPGLPTATVRVTLQTEGSQLNVTAPPTPAAEATFVANQTAYFHGSRVLARLSRDLHGDYSPSALAQKVHASAATTGTLVTVDVTDADPAAAMRIANSLVTAYREVVRFRNLTASAAAIKDISAAQARLMTQLEDAFRAGRAAKATADATALAELAVEATRVQVNSTLYDDGVLSWQDATGASGGKRVPDVRLTLAGLAIGLLVGVVVAWIRADRNREVRTGAEASRWLGSPLLAEVPEILGGLPTPFAAMSVPDVRRHRRPRGRPTDHREETPAARAPALYFRVASVLAADEPHNVFAVTAAIEGSGATTTAIAIAASAARDGKRVLLVDADPCARGLAKAAHIASDAPGLYEVASGLADAQSAIVTRPVGDGFGLDVLPAGTASDRYPHVLRSSTGRSTLQALGTQYDRVVVDTGPLLRSAETVASVTLVDAVLVVVRHGIEAELVSALREQLMLLRARHLGCVFTFSTNDFRETNRS